jgi:threonine/homoserine/homoserine lactone efflux protein
MSRPWPEVMLYALIAAASPLALAAALVVLRSGRGRLNGTAFAVGFVAGQALVVFAAYAIGSASVEERSKGHTTLSGLIELGIGVVLLVVAARLRARPLPRPRASGPRGQAILARLQRLGPFQALGAGALIGIGGPKRLVISVLAAATISVSTLGTDGEVALAVVYILIATVLVWLPVGLYVIAGKRAEQWIVDLREWLNRYQPRATLAALVGFGLFFVVDAVIRLA